MTGELVSLILDDSQYAGFFRGCAEVRNKANSNLSVGHLGFYLNGSNIHTEDERTGFLATLDSWNLARSFSIDSRYLADEEIMNIIRNAEGIEEIRIIGDNYAVTNEDLRRLPSNATIIVDRIDSSVDSNEHGRIHQQFGIYRKDFGPLGDYQVSSYFVNHELSDEEIDYLVEQVNNDRSGDYRQISLRVYDPSSYANFISRLYEHGLNENVRIELLANPLYDRSEVFIGLDEISNNPVNIIYDTCSDMVDFYTKEPYVTSNNHHSELEGGGKTGLTSYVALLSVLETEEKHIKDQGYTPLEAAVYAYRYLQENYAYDPNHKQTDSQNYLTNRQLDMVAGSPTLVCEGYATLYSALMRRCGIPMFRYSTKEHVRNVARIVDPKYGVDNIGVFDTTFDGSSYDDAGTFVRNHNMSYFMISPRNMAIRGLDEYVTLPVSLVLDTTDGIGFASRDIYESLYEPSYTPEGYAITMLDRMGLKTPSVFTRENYSECLADLNNTPIFDDVSTDTLISALDVVLAKEYSDSSDLSVQMDRIRTMTSFLSRPFNLLGAAELDILYGEGFRLLPEEEVETTFYTFRPHNNTLSIASVNKESTVEESAVIEDSDSISTDINDTQVDVSDDTVSEQTDVRNIVSNEEVGNQDTSIVQVNQNGAVITQTGSINQNGGINIINIGTVNINGDDEEEFIAGTSIRKPRGILDDESEEDYVNYLADYYRNYFPEAVEVDREENTTYSLTREQIIQDLPIYSTEESRYTSSYTDQEVEEIRERIEIHKVR